MELHSFYQAVFGCLGNLEIATLQFVIEVIVGYLIPFDCGSLILGDNVSLGRIDFLEYIGCMSANEYILKCRYTVCIGYSVLLYGKSRERSAGQLKLYPLHQSVFRILRNLQRPTLENIVECYSRSLTANNRYRSNFLRLILISHNFSYGVTAGLEVIDFNLTIGIGGNGFVNTVPFNGETDTCHLTILGVLHDLGRSGDQFVDCFNCDGGIGRFRIQSLRPCSRTIGSVIGRKYRFCNGISAIRDSVLTLSVAITIGGADYKLFVCFGIGRSKIRTGKSIAIGIFLIDLDAAIILEDVIGKMEVCVRIGGLITSLSHPVNTGNLGATIIAYMNNEIHTFVCAGVDGYMLMAILRITEDNNVTRSKFASINIGGACANLLDFTFVCQAIESFLPCHNRLGVPSGRLNRIRDKLRIYTLDVG